MDNDKDAVEQFNRVLELNPDFHAGYMDLKMSYVKLSEDEHLNDIIKKAIEFYPGYLLKYPDDARAHIFHAVFLRDSGRIDEATEKMDRAIELSPNDAVMMYNAACFYAGLNEKQSALKNLINAVEKGFKHFEYIKHDPDLEIIRKEPEYIELMQDK